LILILRNSPKWKGVIAFDQFNYRVVIRKNPPWGPEELGAPWSDHWDALTIVWFQAQAKISPASGIVGRAVQAAARHNSFHPVREILESYSWDGKPRLDTYLVQFFRVKDSTYTRAVGSKFLISMVARVLKPGCKVDTIIILEGPQGKYKSEALRILAIRDEYFTDNLSNIASREAQQEVAGVWLIEIGELEALRRVAVSQQKRFLSQRDDRFRPPFGRYVGRVPRQNVFAGTVNPPSGGEGYLPDHTGARRFWPVYCPDLIDVGGLEQERPQIFAEAVRRFKSGEQWWFAPGSELEALATAEQFARIGTHPWERRIVAWLGDQKVVSIDAVLKHALGLRDWTHADEIHVQKILTTKLHFVRYRPHPKDPEGPARPHLYRREISSQDPDHLDHLDREGE
jgi:predicted P-loop ATPase